MSTSYRASIIIPTYRRPELLRNLLRSLALQAVEHLFEVIVVNDGGEDDLRSLEVEFSDISAKLINLRGKSGRSVARNAGIQASSGDIIIFLDDDMTVVDDFITNHIKMHINEITVVVGNVLSPPEYRSHPLARYIQRQGVGKLRSKEQIPAKCFRTGNASVSKELLCKVGMFDESLRKYGEDLDLAMKLDYSGARFVFSPGAISYHHHPPDIEDMMDKMREYGRFTLPILAMRHPELKKATRIHLVEPLKLGEDNPMMVVKKLALRTIMISPVYRLALLLYRFKALGRLLFPVIDYLRAYSYMRAYWDFHRLGNTR